MERSMCKENNGQVKRAEARNKEREDRRMMDMNGKQQEDREGQLR